jgi:hypothetical protein
MRKKRYRPAERQPQMVDSAMSHIGFRCVVHGEAHHHKIATKPNTPIRMSMIATVMAIGRMAL